MRPGPIPTNNFTNMSRVVKTFDGYLMLLDAVYFNGLRIGNISEEGITWGGDEAQTIELWAAQIRTNPVKEVRTRDATNEITGKMIECVARNLKTLLGGTVTEERWDAPAESMIAEGDMKILAGTGATIDIRRVTLRASNMRGGLGGENTLGVEFGFKILAPLDGGSPYAIYPTEPFIEAETKSLSFPAVGGALPIDIEASGRFSVGPVPDGFAIEIVNGRVTVVAAANTSSVTRTGNIDFILEADTEKRISVALTQEAS